MQQHKNILFSVLVASSVINQAELIKKLVEAKGFKVTYKKNITVYDIKSPFNYSFLWFTLASVAWLGDTVFPYIYCTKPKGVYVTIEGIPTKANLLCSNIPKLEFIANSEFTKKCLEQIGLNVKDVVHHAIDYENCIKLKEESNEIRRKWEIEFGQRTKIIYVGRNDPRKGVENLAKAVFSMPENVRDKFVLLLFTEGELYGLDRLKNVLQLGNFGTTTYDNVLKLIGASDYLVFPSKCEGFGLPVLEANAMGIPAIHAWFPPLSEFSSKDFNFVFGYQYETMANNRHLQYWIFHEYRPQLLAEMMQYAIDVHQNSKNEYNEYCAKAVEHAKNWDYKIIYPKLLEHIGVT